MLDMPVYRLPVCAHPYVRQWQPLAVCDVTTTTVSAPYQIIGDSFGIIFFAFSLY